MTFWVHPTITVLCTWGLTPQFGHQLPPKLTVGWRPRWARGGGAGKGEGVSEEGNGVGSEGGHLEGGHF